MEFSDWSVVAELISAIGIIITLIYLALQVHQNTRQEEFCAPIIKAVKFLVEL